MSSANRLVGVIGVAAWLVLIEGCGGGQKAADAGPSGRGPMPKITVTGKLARYVYGKKTVAEWLDDLDAPRWIDRQSAASMLGAMGPEAAVVVPALIWALDDEDKRVRAAVAWGLGYMTSEADRLVPILQDRAVRDVPEVTASACQGLSLLCDDSDRAISALVQLTREKRPDVRAAAVDRLGGADKVTETAVLRLIELAATEPGSALGKSAARSLQQLDFKAVAGILAGFQDPRPAVAKSAIEAFSRVKKSARAAGASVPALRRLLRHQMWTIRWATAEFLADMGNVAKAAAPDLIAALDDKVAVVASEAARALGGIGPEGVGAVPALVRVLGTATREDLVRWSAADALRPLAGTNSEVLKAILEATPVFVRRGRAQEAADEEMADLLEVMRDKAAEVRAAVSAALGKVDAAAVPGLRETLRHQDAIVRQAAAGVLGGLGPDAEAALDDLMAALPDPDGGVRAEVARAIGALGRKAAKAAPALRAALRDEDPRVRAAGAGALGKVGPDPAIDAPELVKLLDDKHARFEAACALAGMGREVGARAVPVLVFEATALFSLRMLEAEEALAKLGDAAVPELLKALESAGQSSFQFANIAAVLGKIGPEAKAAVPALGAALGSEDRVIRLNAARALGGIGPEAKAAAPELRKRLEDPDEDVRKAAKEALAKVEGASGG